MESRDYTTRDTILNILKTNIKNENDYNDLSTWLLSSGYFDAPYTTEYQYSYEGGLAQYSLDVYNNLCTLVKDYTTDNEIDSTTLAIVGLLHLVSKHSYYEPCVNNVKVYTPYGDKYDEVGNYTWYASKSYRVKDASKRDTLGSFGIMSYMIISQFVPLSEQGIMSLMYYNYNENTKDIYTLIRRYPLIALLNCAITLTLNVTYRGE